MTDNTEKNTDPVIAVLAITGSSILQTLHSYQNFSQTEHTENAKEFALHHTSCKAALAHLEALLKLQTLCRTQTAQNSKNPSQDIEKLLQQTRQVLSAHDLQ